MYIRQIVAAILLTGVYGAFAADRPLTLPATSLKSLTSQSVVEKPSDTDTDPQVGNSLTLEDAARLVLAHNPELRVFRWRSDIIAGARQTAELKPEYELSLIAENFGGSRDFSSIDSAELTLSLSSIIELGNKRALRSSVQDTRYELLQSEQKAEALNLLSTVTRTFISILSLQHKLEVAGDAERIAEQSYKLVDTRVKRGASPAAERLRSKATLIQTKIEYRALVGQLESQKFALANLWNAETASFSQVQGDLFRFTEPEDFDSLFRRVASSPAIQIFGSQERLREAELSLVRSSSVGDLRWSFGVRRLEETGNTALIGELAVPLSSKRRNRGKVRSALADRELLQEQKEAALLLIRSRLFEAWQIYQQSGNASIEMRAELVPALENALKQTREAYEQGLYGYIDLLSAQQDLLTARYRMIDSATTALLSQALIEQITAESLKAQVVSTRNEQASIQGN